MAQREKYAAEGSSTQPSGDGSQRATIFEDSFFPTLDRPVLVTLISLDLVLITLHILTGAVFDSIPKSLNIALDHSIAEFFGYAKWAAIIVLIWLINWRTRNLALLSCAAIFLVMLADDSFQIHETIGEAVAKTGAVGDVSWADAQSLAELAVFAGLAALLVPFVSWGFMKSSRTQWVPALRFIGLIALFAVFGGVIDASHKLMAGVPFGAQLADLVEDGGEMIVSSIIVAHAVWLSNDRLIGHDQANV